MRTLKKALSLVLVLAMVFTLAVPALAVDKAADFKDYDKVENKEAVDVLTALGVINGNADGTFGAEGKFTRAQGATMIAYLTLGKTVADALPTGGTQFTDVPANFWGAKYIQYCANEGIINGYGNGKFGPDDELTAAQWALMLLGALGYQAKNEGIGGAGWEIQVTKLAMNAKVATAEDMTGAMTRDTAAKMAFNTLKANVVAYESNGTDITIGDTNINVGATKAEAVKNSEADDYRANDKDEIQQFCELHFPKLKLTAKDNDDFGRPATEWKIGTTTTIGTYAKEATLSYTTKVTGGKLYTDLGKVTPDTLTITRNGVGASSTTDALATIKSGNTDTFDLTGNGVLTEVYYDADTKTATVVEITTKLGKITAYTPAKTNKDGEVTQKATITVDGKTFETNAYSKADVNKTYVLYTYIGDKSYKTVGTIKSVATATSETMVPTRVNGTTSFVAGGETYSYTLGTTPVSADTVTNKDEVVVYFDSYGYVIGTSKPAAAVGQYAFVIDSVKDTSDIWNSNKYVAKVVLNTGKETTIVELTSDSEKEDAIDGKIVSYEVSNGKYKLTPVTDALAKCESKDTLTITKGVANGAVGTATVFSSKTVFLVISGTEKEPVYTVYTGINNVPSLVGTAGTTAVMKADKGIAEFVVVKNAAGGATSTTDTYFVLGSDVDKTVDVTDGEYYEYKAVVNGELTTVKTSEKIAKGSYKFVSSVSVNEKGVITAFGTAVESKKATGTEAYDADLGLVKFVSGDGKGSFTVSSDCAVYTVENGEITVGSIDNILTDANDTVVYTLKDGVVTSVYVTVVD